MLRPHYLQSEIFQYPLNRRFVGLESRFDFFLLLGRVVGGAESLVSAGNRKKKILFCNLKRWTRENYCLFHTLLYIWKGSRFLLSTWSVAPYTAFSDIYEMHCHYHEYVGWTVTFIEKCPYIRLFCWRNPILIVPLANLRCSGMLSEHISVLFILLL